jgi:hypothetical protein
MWPAGLSSFRVYRREPAAVYRETVPRRDELGREGVQQFAQAFDKLFDTIAKRRRTLLEAERACLKISPGSPEMKAAVGALS